MELNIPPKLMLFGIMFSLLLNGCATTNTVEESAVEARQQELAQQAKELEIRSEQLAQKEAELEAQKAQLNATASSRTTPLQATSSSTDLLPPYAKPGECYARLWAEPSYETTTQQVKVRDASEKIRLIPATYTTATERVLVAEASTKKIPVPAVYATKTTQVKVSEPIRSWLVGPKRNSAPASDALLKAAQQGGADLDAVEPKTCFREYFKPARYDTVTEQVLVNEGTENVEIIPARYETVEKRILIAESSTKLVNVPAVYETITEQVIDKPKHTIWKKGTGPIQKIDEITGEIMCLVEVPATYKTITKRVLRTPATVKEIPVPAKYDIVQVRTQVAPPDRKVVKTDPIYESVTKKKLVSEPEFVWYQSNQPTRLSRTGNQVCLHEIPAQYRTVKTKTVKKPASFRVEEIPAQYKTVRVRKLASPAKEQRTEIPAEFKTVTSTKLVREGQMEWRSILCETNMTGARITNIQKALRDKGYNPGRIDGEIGAGTMRAVNAFQRAQGLPVDKYLNIKTLQALGVSPR